MRMMGLGITYQPTNKTRRNLQSTDKSAVKLTLTSLEYESAKEIALSLIVAFASVIYML